MKYVIVAILALLLGAGLGHVWDAAHHRIELGNAYGCGLVYERKLWFPPEDSIDIPERPWCARYHRLWDEG